MSQPVLHKRIIEKAHGTPCCKYNHGFTNMMFQILLQRVISFIVFQSIFRSNPMAVGFLIRSMNFARAITSIFFSAFVPLARASSLLFHTPVFQVSRSRRELHPAMQEIRKRYKYNHTHNATSLADILAELAAADAICTLSDAPEPTTKSANAVQLLEGLWLEGNKLCSI